MLLNLEGRQVAPRRVFCIGRNYRDHIAELGGEVPDEVVIFMKPDTALLPEGVPIPVPDHGDELHYEAEVVLLIGREGRVQETDDYTDFIAGVSLGLDMTLRDVQRRIFAATRPWELCKAFDGSAPIGRFRRLENVPDLGSLRFTCTINDEVRQRGDVRDMLFPPGTLLKAISRAWKLLPGDLVFTGTPAGIGGVNPGDRIRLESDALGRFDWRVGARVKRPD